MLRAGIDVILRYYGLEEMLAHPDGDALMEPVFRAHENGTVVVWTPTNVFGNKGTLAMLSEFAEDASVFSAQERAVIERVLPLLEASGCDTMRMPDPGKKRRRQLTQVLQAVPELNVIIDTFEQRVQRPRERAEADTSALRISEPANHELLRRLALHLQPVR